MLDDPPSLYRPPTTPPLPQRRKTTASSLARTMPVSGCQMLRYNCIAQERGWEGVDARVKRKRAGVREKA